MFKLAEPAVVSEWDKYSFNDRVINKWNLLSDNE